MLHAGSLMSVMLPGMVIVGQIGLLITELMEARMHAREMAAGKVTPPRLRWGTGLEDGNCIWNVVKERDGDVTGDAHPFLFSKALRRCQGTDSRSVFANEFHQDKGEVGNAGDPAFLFMVGENRFFRWRSWRMLGDVSGGTAVLGRVWRGTDGKDFGKVLSK